MGMRGSDRYGISQWHLIHIGSLKFQVFKKVVCKELVCVNNEMEANAPRLHKILIDGAKEFAARSSSIYCFNFTESGNFSKKI